jgi:hypothetical protein
VIIADMRSSMVAAEIAAAIGCAFSGLSGAHAPEFSGAALGAAPSDIFISYLAS